MEAFISRKKPRLSPPAPGTQSIPFTQSKHLDKEEEEEEESTDLKLATLSSLFPTVDQATLLDLLISFSGSVTAVSHSLSPSSAQTASPRKRPSASVGHQTSLSAFRPQAGTAEPAGKRRALTKKGQTLHLYTPEDVAAHTPCSIIHSFLPAREADGLLRELLEEAQTFERQTFKLFDNVVSSPHSACFYVDGLEERERQRSEYLYNGSYLNVGTTSCCSQGKRSSFLLLITPLVGRAPDHTTNAGCLPKGSACGQRRDRQTYQKPLSKWHEAQVSVTSRMDSQCGIRELVPRRERKRGLSL